MFLGKAEGKGQNGARRDESRGERGTVASEQREHLGGREHLGRRAPPRRLQMFLGAYSVVHFGCPV